jgi:hemerythrin-like domain-containing protein
VEKLFTQLEGVATSDRRRAVALVAELDEALTLHAEIEERHFYPMVRTSRTEELVAESFEEHRLMKQTLADVVAAANGRGDGKVLAAKLEVLREQVVHHAREEEEQKLFPLVRELLSEEQLEALAQEMTGTIVELQGRKRGPARPLRGQPSLA